MKIICKLFFFFLILISCEKIEDDSNSNCTSNCTTLMGKFVSLDNVPIPNIKVEMRYRVSGGGFGGGSTRKLVNISSDKNGNFNKKFFIQDSELGMAAPGFFQVHIDDSNLYVSKYIRTNNLIGNGYSDIGFAIYSISDRDTIIDKTFYFPKKAFIKVNLNNFAPIQENDFFEVQTLYPFGAKVGSNTFLNSEYSTGFSGYGNWRATNLNNSLNVFVAEGENNIIRIYRRKNGENTSEDILVKVPVNNSIELTYNY